MRPGGGADSGSGDPGFRLHPQLEADTAWVADLPVCTVLLMDNSRYPWLILVPRRPALVGLLDLDEDMAAAVWREVGAMGRILQTLETPHRLNVAALGNVVPQLHIHVVARRVGDAAWPRPVWGTHPPVPYGPGDAERWIEAFQRLMVP